MKWTLLKNDLRKNKGSHLAVVSFMALSVMIAVTVCILLMQLFTALNDLYERAEPPHFLQMHKGELKQEEIDAFNEKYEGIAYWQTAIMVNVYGEQLEIQKENTSFSLKACRLDIGLVKQNQEKDLLLDSERRLVTLSKGEIGVPAIVAVTYGIEEGDTLILSTEAGALSFVVKEIIFDAQMNSTMCSSTRFLLSDEDFEYIRGKTGEIEYLIEAYFDDKSMANDYQTAYEQEENNLPKNGQAVTISMIFLLSAMTDIITGMLFVLIAVLLVGIVFVNLKYIILTEMEEELKEIGNMKAIGIPHQAIENIYLDKFKLLLGIGSVIGFACSFFMSNVAVQHVRDTFGDISLSGKEVIGAVLVAALVYLITIFYCRTICRKIRTLSIMDTLVSPIGIGKGKTIFLSAVMLLLCSILILPLNLIQTMKDKAFVTYMGSGICDVLVSVEPGENLEERMETVKKLFDKEKIPYEGYRTVRLETESTGGRKYSIHIDTGEKAGDELQYLVGKKPTNNDEIALSKLVADHLEKNISDELVLYVGEELMTVRVCGIYQDVTSGGMTSKMIYDFKSIEAEKYAFTVNIPAEDEAEGAAMVEKWRKELGGSAKIEWMEEFLQQTLGDLVSQVEMVAVAGAGIALLLAVIITILYLKLRLAREASQIAVKKAIGCSNRSICIQELRFLLKQILPGVVLGTIFVNVFGEQLVSLLFSLLGLGIERIHFSGNPLMNWVLLPGLLVGVTLLVGMLANKKIKSIDIMEYVNEV